MSIKKIVNMNNVTNLPNRKGRKAATEAEKNEIDGFDEEVVGGVWEVKQTKGKKSRVTEDVAGPYNSSGKQSDYTEDVSYIGESSCTPADKKKDEVPASTSASPGLPLGVYDAAKTLMATLSPEEIKTVANQHYYPSYNPYLSSLYAPEKPTLDERLYRKACNFIREAISKGVSDDITRKMRDDMIQGLLERILYGSDTYEQFIQLYML